MNAPDLDARFAEFVATGDPGPLGDVFDATTDDLYRLALHLCGAPALAEDLVQATWLKAIEGADTFATGSPVRPWLTGILHNEARMHFRRERVRSRPPRREAEPLAEPSVEAERRELAEILDARIADLPDPYGPVVRLHLRHGLPANAIGEALGRPAGTVRTQLVRGLDRLRAILPSSLAGLAAAWALPTRGIAAVREQVLQTAAGAELAAAGAVGAVGTAAGWRAIALALALVGVTVAALVWEPWARDVPAPAVATARVAEPGTGEAAANATTAPTAGAARIEVAAPATDPSPTTVGAPVGPDLRLAGRIVRADGAPIPDAGVFAFEHTASVAPDGSFDAPPLASTRSDVAGQFELRIARGARFELFARGDGWAQSEAIRGTGDRDLSAYADARIVLAPAVTLRGRVVDPSGRGIADQEVRFVSTYGSSLDLRQDHPSILRSAAGRRRAVTDEAGAFAIVGPAGHRFWTEVEHPDFLRYSEHHRFSAEEPLRIQLAPGDEISGRAFLADSRPAAGAKVRLDSATYRRTVADADGRFAIRGVDLGDDRERGYLSIEHSEAAAFCLSPIPARHRDLTLRLPTPRRLTGSVVDADGRPLAGAILRVVGDRMVTPNAIHGEPTTWEWTQGVEKTESDADGRFVFDRLNAGPYTLQAAVEDLTAGVVEVPIADGQTEVAVRITEAATRKAVLAGRVVDAHAQTPIADAAIRVHPVVGGRIRETRSDADGQFELTGFEPGGYVCSVAAGGFATRDRILDLQIGDNRLDVGMVNAVDVTVRLLRADGEPWTNGSVRVTDAAGRAVAFRAGNTRFHALRLDENGAIWLTAAPAEIVTLSVDPADASPFDVAIDLRHIGDGEVLDVVGGRVTTPVRLMLAIGVARGAVAMPDPTTAEGKQELMALLRDGKIGPPAAGVTVTLLDAHGRELSRGTATPVGWDEVANPARWREARAMGFPPMRVRTRWAGGTTSSSPRPMPLAEFDLRGRSEPMLLRIEAEGHATLERRIDGASLPRFDEPAPSVPRFILLQD